MLLANLHFVPLSAASPVGDQLSLKFRKTSQDVDQQIMRWTLFAGQFAKNHPYATTLQVALNDSQMRDISS
jgi:hypothetical protein